MSHNCEELLVRWEQGQTDMAEEAELTRLLADPAQRRVFRRQARIAGLLAALPARPASGTDSRLRPSTAWRSRPRAVPSVGRRQFAASLLALGGLAVVAVTAAMTVAPWPAHPAAAYVGVTPAAGLWLVSAAGARRPLTSTDLPGAGDAIETGATAAAIDLGHGQARFTLAAQSRLRLPLSPPLREQAIALGLERGSLMAEVAHRDPGHPMTITADATTATIIGTRFTFGYTPAGIRLAVSDGAVRLGNHGEPGIVIAHDQCGIAADGMSSLLPTPLPAPTEPGWQRLVDYDDYAAAGWRAVVEDLGAATRVWRSIAPPLPDQWSLTEIRSPIASQGWVVTAGARLRFAYQFDHSRPGQRLAVHLKPSDETNFSIDIPAASGSGWQQADLDLGAAFRHIGNGQGLTPGIVIHGIVWCLQVADATAEPGGRLWIAHGRIITSP